LDDLFVDPSQRSRGIGRLLLEALNETSRARDWAMLSWVTAQDNATARRLYDDVAKAANWVTYELTP
jgi:GNAT superfamily N-acetyltransferase